MADEDIYICPNCMRGDDLNCTTDRCDCVSGPHPNRRPAPERPKLYTESELSSLLASARADGGDAESTTSIGGKPLTWRELVEYERSKANELQGFARLLSDLDRSANGRHEGDGESQDPSGFSQGNPHLATGQIIGYDISGRRYVVPEPHLRGSIEAWKRPRAAVPLTERNNE